MNNAEKLLKELSQIHLYRTNGVKKVRDKDFSKVYDLVLEARRYFIDESSNKVDRQAAHLKDSE